MKFIQVTLYDGSVSNVAAEHVSYVAKDPNSTGARIWLDSGHELTIAATAEQFLETLQSARS